MYKIQFEILWELRKTLVDGRRENMVHLLIVDGKLYVEGKDFHVDESGVVIGFGEPFPFSVATLIQLPKGSRVLNPKFEQ